MRILLIKKGAMGDLLMATPFIRQLKQIVKCDIDILVGQSSASVLNANPYLAKQFIVPESIFSTKQVIKFVMYLYQLRKNNYDYVFILDKHWYFNLCAKIIGAISIGFEREAISRYLLDFSVKYNDNTKYHGIYNLELLATIYPQQIDFIDMSLDVFINNAHKIKVENWLGQSNITNFVILVNSGGNNAFESNGVRMLPDELCLSLIERLSLIYDNILLVGSALDKPKYVSYQLKLPHIVNLHNIAGIFNLAESTYLFSLAKKIYATDCGALHLSVASNNPNIIGLFGPTNPRHVLPSYYVTKAYWQDEDVYTPDYSLYGNKGLQHQRYFTKLEVANLILSS